MIAPHLVSVRRLLMFVRPVWPIIKPLIVVEEDKDKPGSEKLAAVIDASEDQVTTALTKRTRLNLEQGDIRWFIGWLTDGIRFIRRVFSRG